MFNDDLAKFVDLEHATKDRISSSVARNPLEPESPDVQESQESDSSPLPDAA